MHALWFLPALVAQAPAADAWEDAVETVLRHLDESDVWQDFRPPKVSLRYRASLDYLMWACAGPEGKGGLPKGVRGRPEAQQVAAWVRGERTELPVSLTEVGSQVALWQVGSRRVRQGNWAPVVRKAWEDRLLQEDIHGLLREYALRHALCFAVAERDESRLQALKEAWGQASPILIRRFQLAFSNLGHPAPALRLWSLPDLAPTTVPLVRPGLRRVVVAQARNVPEQRPAEGTVWIIPSELGQSSSQEDILDEATRKEVAAWVSKLGDAASRCFLAPSEHALEPLGLFFFPAVLELDEAGRLVTLRMGDAARAVPAKP